MPAVTSQMDGNPVSSCELSQNRCSDRIRLVSPPGLTNCGDVIDIHSQFGHITPFPNDE
jgi:hypothetical protein